MKSKEKMVLSTDKKSKTTKKPSSSSTAKKFVKKEQKEKIHFSLIDKSSEDLNDSADFISLQNKRKPIKNGKSPIELASAASKEPKKRTSQRSQSSSLPQTAPLSPTETLTRRRTRSSEQKVQEAERNGDADNLKFPNGSPVLPSCSGAASKGTSESKPAKCSSQESKKQTSQTLKLSKVKVEPPEKDETLKQTLAKKLVKSEQVRSISTPEKERMVPATKRRSSRSRSKSSETSDSLNLSEKSSPKADTSGGKKVKRKKLYQESPKTTTVKLDQPPRKRAQKSSKPDHIPPKCVQRKNTEKKNENNVSSEIVTTAAGKSPPNLQSLTGDEERSKNSAANTGQNNTVKCPTCKNLIPEEGLGRHILMCLKNKYQVDAKSRLPVLSDREQFCKDEALARQIHEDINKDLQSCKDSKSTEDLTFCHVCQKDLSHMNSVWRAKHINHCFDNTDVENARKKKKLAVNARQQVPACPMCGKQFKTGALRRCHLKKCAQDLSISPEKAVKLIAEQEKNFNPSLPAPATSSSTSARSLRNKLNKLPDEQMQVALALSSSLFEEQKKLNEQLAETVKNIHQGVNRDLRKLKKSQKKASASMPLLLTISKEDQLARNAQRVDSIISEPAHTMHFPKQFPRSSLSLNYGDVYQLHENTSCPSSLHSFWSRASLMNSSLTPNLFYIQSLMPPIQVDKVTAGSRLKPLSAIPGRGLDKEDIPSVTDNLPDSSAVPSTQTAVLLAELAQSNEEDLDDEESSGCTFKPTQGFYLSQEASNTPGTQENKALIALSEDLCNLVNNPHLSDIEFIAADSSRVCAHQLLLSVRCPLILSLAVQRENHLVIDVKDVSHNALLAFLRYLYAGRVDFEKNVTADLLQLSRKFNLPQLAVICEKTLQALIDEACYTPSVESVAGDIPETLDIGDDHLQGNEEDGNMMVDNNSLLEPNKEDIEFRESLSEKLCSLPRASPLKSPHSTGLHSSPNRSYRELPAAVDEQIFKTIAGLSDAEFSPEKQHDRKPPIPGCDLLTDCSTSVIEKAADFIGKSSSCKDAPTSQDITYKTPTSLKLDEETETEGRCSDTISEQNTSSLTQQVSAFQRELKGKKFPVLISKDTESEGMLTSFGGLLSGKHLDRRCLDNDNISPSVSQMTSARGYTEQTASPPDRGCSNRSLLLARHQEKEANLCEDNSVNSNSVSGTVSGHEFDDSNELFSEPEELENLKVSEVNNEKLKAKAGLVDEFGEISNDSICFVSENQQHTLGTGMLSTALHLADTVCENSADEDLVSGGSAVKLTSPASRPQIPFSKCTILNGNIVSFHMADTILEVSKDLKNSSDFPCVTAASPLSATSRGGQMKTTNLEGSESRCCPRSTKSLKEYSPISLLGRFNNATQDSGMGFGSEFEVKELNNKLSTSPKFSFSPLSGTRTDLEVRNLGRSLHEDSANVHRNFQQRSKRKSCRAEFSPLPKMPPRKRRNVNDVGSETTASHLKGCFTGAHFSKETGLQFSPFEKKNNTSYDAIDHLSNLASADSLEMTTITSDLNKNSPEKLVSKNQTKTVEKWLALAEDNSPCDAEVSLSNSPGSILDRNLDMFSQLSEDSITEDKSDRDLKAGVPLENDSDLEMGLYSKKCTDFGANLDRNPDCLHGSSSPKTLGTRGKKFTFKRTQLKNIKTPVICASSTLGHTPAKKKNTGRLRSSSDDLGHSSDKVESDYEYQPDIWEDFEDNGHMEDFVELSSPTRQNLSTVENISAKKLDCKDNSFNLHLPTSPEVANEIANKESFNSSFITDFISSSSPVMSQMEDSLHLVVDTEKNSNRASHSAKTPVIANRKGRKKKTAIPSPFTPMPLYMQMTTPELKAEMKKHGCKQMPHGKMVAHLMDIYQKTHQYETDSDLDQSAVHLEAPSEMPHSSLGIARLQTRRNTQDCFLQAHNEKKSPVTVKSMSKKPATKLPKKAKSSELGSGVSAQRSSSESDSANVVDLDKSDAVGAYEESFMTHEDDIPCSQQQMSGSCDNLHDKLREFVLKSPEIYTKMILYEPIDFDQLKKKIAEAKIKCTIPKLLDFLDNQCITFAMNKEKQHHGSWKRRVARK